MNVTTMFSKTAFVPVTVKGCLNWTPNGDKHPGRTDLKVEFEDLVKLDVPEGTKFLTTLNAEMTSARMVPVPLNGRKGQQFARSNTRGSRSGRAHHLLIKLYGPKPDRDDDNDEPIERSVECRVSTTSSPGELEVSWDEPLIQREHRRKFAHRRATVVKKHVRSEVDAKAGKDDIKRAVASLEAAWGVVKALLLRK